MSRRLLLAAVLAVGLGPVTTLAADMDEAAKVEFFEKKVRPLLAGHCHACHSAETKPSGDLRVDDRNGLLTGLEAKGLKPVGDADKATLLRRVTFDLIGLPPAPAEIDAFVADTSPQALEKVVDRLLSSPAFDKRWGRHWLDVARCGESTGPSRNIFGRGIVATVDNFGVTGDTPSYPELLDYLASTFVAGGCTSGVTCRQLLDELTEKLQTKLAFSAQHVLDAVADLLTSLRLVASLVTSR